MLPSPHGRSIGERLILGREPGPKSSVLIAPSLDAVAACAHGLPEVDTISKVANNRGLFELRSIDNTLIGWAGRTLPEADDVAGYRGPTEALLVLDDQQTIVGVDILNSHDTDEHVDEVRKSASFFQQFVGLTWGGKSRAGETAQIDGVSGATLTSLAMARGVLKRLGNETRSLVFDRPIDLADARKFFPDSGAVQGDPVAIVFANADDPDSRLGTLVRTGAIVDDEIGYQGPTEMLLAFDSSATLVRVSVRQSFDNEPYVGYVPQEYSFWKMFTGKNIAELAAMDVVSEGVEGVSGATMTSMAIAYSLPRVAAKIQAASPNGTTGVAVLDAWNAPTQPSSWTDTVSRTLDQVQWSLADGVTLGFLSILLALTATHQMRRKAVRRWWLVAVVIGIGWWTGNLISLALIAGWATSGASWYLAIGLVALVAIAMIIPPTWRGNPYCNHLCPHGAIQQLVRPTSRSRRKWNWSIQWQRWIANLPAVTLALAYLLLLFRPSTDVSALEPFHAYLWSIASWTAIAFTGMTLLFSVFVPMGYCRLGCPTGRLFEHIRLKTSGIHWCRFDWGVLCLFLVAVLTRTINR